MQVDSTNEDTSMVKKVPSYLLGEFKYPGQELIVPTAGTYTLNITENESTRTVWHIWTLQTSSSVS